MIIHPVGRPGKTMWQQQTAVRTARGYRATSQKIQRCQGESIWAQLPYVRFNEPYINLLNCQDVAPTWISLQEGFVFDIFSSWGGFNHFEKYYSNWIISPVGVKIKNI